MPTIATKATLLKAQARADAEMTLMLKNTAERTASVIRAAGIGANGTIPKRSADTVKAEAGQVVLSMFVGGYPQAPYAADGVTGLAPLPKLLSNYTAWTTYAVVRQHNKYLTNMLSPDLLAYLQNSRRVVSELTRTEQLKLIAARLRVFLPNPLAEYEPAHTWVDPAGYRLSDRIWQVAIRTRGRIDRIVDEGIRNGDSAVDIAKRVEKFLRADRAAFRTQKPYGRDGSFDALRLTRTEITRANGQAVIVASRMNPFVEKIAWNLSPSHPRTDICDNRAQQGPYFVDSVPPYPPHPHCLCNLSPLVTANPQQVIADLRLVMEMATADLMPYVNPASLDAFTQQLIGETMWRYAQMMDVILEAVA